MSSDRLHRAASALKVFPLPGTVLFPRALLPLNIFEARYRALVKDCLDGDRVMAMGQLLPGWQRDYEGRPPLAPLLTVAMLTSHEELEDGRYNILLEGVVRGRVVRELAPRKLYREVEVELLEDPPYHGPEEELLRQTALRLAAQLPKEVAEQFVQAVAREEGGALADVVASAVVDDEATRSLLLAELDVKKRLSAVVDEVGIVIARLTQRPTGMVN